MTVNTMLRIAHAPVLFSTRKSWPLLHTASCGTPPTQPSEYDDGCIRDGSIVSSGREEMQRTRRHHGGLQIGEAVGSSSSSSSNSSNSPQMERVEPQSEEENSLGLSDHEKTLCNNSPYENIMQSYLLMKEHTISNERDGAIKQPLNPTTRQQIRHSSTIYFHVILLLLLPITLTNGQQGSNNNPNNKFCGVNYNEAHLFCHLPPEQSLPCPNGSDENCPYGMPCWEIREECTPPPTPEPTHYPTSSPAARTDRPTLPRSTIAGDHNFCGLGFTNLFGWYVFVVAVLIYLSCTRFLIFVQYTMQRMQWQLWSREKWMSFFSWIELYCISCVQNVIFMFEKVRGQ